MFSEVGGQILLPWLTDVLIVYDLWKVSEVLHVELKAKVGMNFKNCFLIFWEHSKPTIVLFRTVKIIIMFKFSCSVVSDSMWPHEPQHERPPCPSPTPRVHPNPLSQWCHPTISSSVVPFSFCSQSFPASGSFQMSQLFASGGQSIGVSASTSVLPVNTQDWYLLGWILLDLVGFPCSLLSKGLSRFFSNTTLQKHQFFGTQLSL